MGYLTDAYTGFAWIERGSGEGSDDVVKIKKGAEVRKIGIDFNKTIENKRNNVFENEENGKLVHGYEIASSYILAEDIEEHKIPFALLDIVDSISAEDQKALNVIFLDVYDLHQALALNFGEVIEVMRDERIIFIASKLAF